MALSRGLRCCQRAFAWVPVLIITLVVLWSYYAYVCELCLSEGRAVRRGEGGARPRRASGSAAPCLRAGAAGRAGQNRTEQGGSARSSGETLRSFSRPPFALSRAAATAVVAVAAGVGAGRAAQLGLWAPGGERRALRCGRDGGRGGRRPAASACPREPRLLAGAGGALPVRSVREMRAPVPRATA